MTNSKIFNRLFFAVTLLIFSVSCKDNLQEMPKTDEALMYLNQAKAWFESTIASHPNARTYGAINPRWDKAAIFKNTIEMPYTKDGKLQLPHSEYGFEHQGRKRILIHKEGSEYSAHIISYIPSDKFNGDIKKINAKDFKSLNFDGKITIQNIEATRMKLLTINNGNETSSFMAHRPSTTGKANGRTADCIYDMTQDCTNWYQWDGHEWDFLDETCEPWELENVWCDNQPVTYTYDPYDCAYTYWPWCDGGGVSAPPNTVTNNTHDPCLSTVSSNLTNANLANDINTGISSIFNSNSNTNLIIKEDTTLTTPAHTSVTSEANPFSVTISLNPNLLSGSSSEYIASIIYHEAMHAYLDAKSATRDQLEQHVEMATSYISWLFDALKEVYPSLPDLDAKGLALRGLRDMMTSNPAYWDQLIHDLGFQSNEQLISITDSYRNGGAGTPCPH